jgi:hypothetical protein
MGISMFSLSQDNNALWLTRISVLPSQTSASTHPIVTVQGAPITVIVVGFVSAYIGWTWVRELRDIGVALHFNRILQQPSRSERSKAPARWLAFAAPSWRDWTRPCR